MVNIYSDSIQTRMDRIRSDIQARDYGGVTTVLTSDLIEILKHIDTSRTRLTNTMSWAEVQLNILTNMLEDRKSGDLPDVSVQWLAKEIGNIKNKLAEELE